MVASAPDSSRDAEEARRLEDSLPDSQPSGSGDAAGGISGLRQEEAAATQTGASKARTKTRVSRIPWKRINKSKGLKKWLIIGGISGGSVGFVGIIVIVLFFIALFEVPSFAHDITSYEFASLSRQFYEQADRTMNQVAAVESASDGTLADEKPGKLTQVWQGLKDKFHDSVIDPVTGKLEPVAQVWDKINSINPNKIIENLNQGVDQGGHGLKIYTKRTALGREVLQAVELDGKTYTVEQAHGLSSWVPVLSDIKIAQNNEAFWRDFKPAFMDAVGFSDQTVLGKTVRSATQALFRRQAGISLGGWILDKFTAKNAPNTDVVNAQEEEAAVNEANQSGDNATTQMLSDAEAAEAHADVEVAANAEETAAALANNGVAKEVVQAGEDHVGGIGDTILSIANPIYGVAVPICILYDGSVIQSGPTIDTNSRRLEASYYDFAAKGDQTKHGASLDATNKDALLMANGALVKQIGPISDFGQETPDWGGTGTAAGGVSPESGSSGGNYYTIFNALGLDPSSDQGKAINYILGGTGNTGLCDVLTNTGFSVAVAAANVIAAIVSLGSSQAAEEAAGQGAIQAVKVFAQNLARNIVTAALGPKVIEESAGKVVERTLANRILTFAFGKVPRFLIKQGAIVGGIALGAVGVNEFTKIMAANRAGQFSSGIAQGEDYRRNLAMGGNLAAQDMQRTSNFGRPLTSPEVATRDTTDKQYLANQVSAENFADRYLALSNPDSLLNHLAMSMASMFRPDFFATLLGNIGSILVSPLTTLGIAHADPNPNTQHFGIVQFGWSEDEEKLINSSSSYLPLQNQAILDQSGRENDIAKQYAKCFGYKYNPNGDGSLDPTDQNGNLQLDVTGDGSMGNLLAHGDIARDNNGNLLNSSDSDCSPVNLGTTNPTYGDLVFRWRLAMSYDTTINVISNLQTVTN